MEDASFMSASMIIACRSPVGHGLNSNATIVNFTVATWLVARWVRWGHVIVVSWIVIGTALFFFGSLSTK